MFRCVILENEPLAIALLEDYISCRKELTLIGIAKDLFELEHLLQSEVDIIFLDFVVPSGNSANFHFGLIPQRIIIVTVSAIPLEMYENRYLLNNPHELQKPISFERFTECIDAITK